MLLSSSNGKYPHFPFFSYFSVVVSLRSLLHHILSLIVYTFRENREFVFISIVQFMMSANSRIRFGLQIAFVCLYIAPSHYHHCANFIWRHLTYKMPVRYHLSTMWVRLSIFSQLSIIQYMGLCVFSLPISFMMIERIYILCLIIIIKPEVWTSHCLGLGHETMACAVCLSILFWVNTNCMPNVTYLHFLQCTVVLEHPIYIAEFCFFIDLCQLLREHEYKEWCIGWSIEFVMRSWEREINTK